MEPIPENTFVNPIEALKDYLEEYPEDILKWSEFLGTGQRAERLHTAYRRLFLEVLPNGEIREEGVGTEQTEGERDTPLTFGLLRKMMRGSIDRLPAREGVCGLCDEPIGSFYSSYLPCGHLYHTDCLMAWDFEHGTECNIQGCNIGPHDKVRLLFRELKKGRTAGMNVAIDSLKKKKEFRALCRDIKRAAGQISSTRTAVKNAIIAERKKVFEFHGDKLNAIQHDLNQIPLKIKAGEIYKQEKLAGRNGRIQLRKLWVRYRLSMRDLVDHLGMRFSWNARWTMERHRNYNHFASWRAGFRMAPGRKTSWKPSEAKKRAVVEVDTDSDSDSSET